MGTRGCRSDVWQLNQFSAKFLDSRVFPILVLDLADLDELD